MINPEQVESLQKQIEGYLRDGIIDAREESKLILSGLELGLEREDIFRLVAQVEKELGLGGRNSALLRFKARAQQFLDNDGVIDANEKFFLREIAQELGLTEDQMNRVIKDLRQTTTNGGKALGPLQSSVFATAKQVWNCRLTKWGTLLIIALFCFWITQPSAIPSHSSEKELMDSLRSLPVKELSLYNFRFNVVTDVRKKEEGNQFLRFTTGGLAGKDIENNVLMSGGVDIRYGIPIELSKETCKVDGDTVKLSLPLPKVIGKPDPIGEGDSALKTIAVKGKDTGEVEQFARAKIQEDAEEWPRVFGLDDITKQRAKDVLTLFIKSAYPGKKVDVTFVGDGEKSKEDTNPIGSEVKNNTEGLKEL